MARPVTCAVALGWPGATPHELPLRPVLDSEVLRFTPDQQGTLTRVVLDLDGPAFTNTWLSAVEAAQRRPQPHQP
jgi:hypothetical protein